MTDYYNEDVEEAYFEPSNAQIAGEIDEQGHLQAEDLYGVQTKIFNMTCNGSLEQFAANKGKATWKLSPDMQSLLRQVTSTTNRSKATSDDLTGDLTKAVLLQATVLEQRNSFPVPIGLNIPGMVPQVYSENKRYNWILEPNTGTSPVNQSIFEPDNVFTKYMYSNLQKLDVESLEKQVRFDVDPTGESALVDHNGIVYDVLMRNVCSGKFSEDDTQYLLDVDERVRSNPYSMGAPIPTDIAKEICEAIKGPLEVIEKSFVDMRKLHGRFERADGEHWNSFSGLIGEAAGMDADSKGFLKQHALTSSYSASVKVQIKYIVY